MVYFDRYSCRVFGRKDCPRRRNGIVVNLIVGIIGGVLGGWLFGLMGIWTAGVVGSLITATVGAIVLLAIVSLFSKRKS